MDGAGAAGSAPAAPAVRGLNESQAEAVLADPAQPLCIFAGAGSGKTLTLCRRMAFALSMGEDPAAILCLTFSRHAAEELRSRVGEMSSSHAATKGARGGNMRTSVRAALRASLRSPTADFKALFACWC